ncbi:MAG: single-stranded DNA-binding protein [Clostridia bacterium]|nr:single-stranded DNA-binding protein [Clostridia bacterium]
MAANNSVNLIGRLVRDPEMRVTQNANEVVSFCIAVENGYGDSKRTAFINCVAWRKTAVFIEKYFCKGNMIAVQGILDTREYTEKNGYKRTVTEVTVDSASFCGGQTPKPPADNEPYVPPEIVDDEDLRF